MAASTSHAKSVCRCVPAGSSARLSWYLCSDRDNNTTSLKNATELELRTAFSRSGGENWHGGCAALALEKKEDQEQQQFQEQQPLQKEDAQALGAMLIDAYTETATTEEPANDSEGGDSSGTIFVANLTAPGVRSRVLEVGFRTAADRDMFLVAIVSCIAQDRQRLQERSITSVTCERAYIVLDVRTPNGKFFEYEFTVNQNASDNSSEAPDIPRRWRRALTLTCLRQIREKLAEQYDMLVLPEFPESRLSIEIHSGREESLEKRRAKMDSFLEGMLTFSAIRTDPYFQSVFCSAAAELAPDVSQACEEHTGSVASIENSNVDGRSSKDALVVRGSGLPSGEAVLHRFSCALVRSIAIHGRLYLSRNYLCFYSNIFGIRSSEIVPLVDVVRVEATGTIIPGILVVLQSAGPERLLEFQSFFPSRDAVLAVIKGVMNSSAGIHPPSCTADDWVMMDGVIENEASASSSSAPTTTTSDEEDDDFFQEWAAAQGAAAQGTGLKAASFDVLLDATLSAGLGECFGLLVRSPSFTERYHVARGDRDVDIQNWQTMEELGHVRQVHYRAPLTHPIGPSSTGVLETHRIVSFSKDILKIEAVQVLADVPMADSFAVEMIWEFREQGPTKTTVKCSVGVHFSKRNWFKSKIETGTRAEAAKSLAQWLDEARKALASHDKQSDDSESTKSLVRERTKRHPNQSPDKEMSATSAQTARPVSPASDIVTKVLLVLILIALVANLFLRAL